MAQGGSLKFVVEVAANNATQTLQAIQTAVDQAGVKMKTTMLGVGDAGRTAAGHMGGFEGRLKSLKTEMVQGDRTINFFANTLTGSLVPASSAAGEALRLLADGFVGGLGVGFGIQAIGLGLKLWGDHIKEANEKAKEFAQDGLEVVKSAGERASAAIGTVWGNANTAASARANIAAMKAAEEVARARIAGMKDGWFGENEDRKKAEKELAELVKKRVELELALPGKLNQEHETLEQKKRDRQLQTERELSEFRVNELFGEDKIRAEGEAKIGKDGAVLRLTHQGASLKELASLELAIRKDTERQITLFRKREAQEFWDWFNRERGKAEAKGNEPPAGAGAGKDGTVPFSVPKGGGLYGIRQPGDLGPTAYSQVGFGSGISMLPGRGPYDDLRTALTKAVYEGEQREKQKAEQAGKEIGNAFAQPIVNSMEDAFARMLSGQESFNDSMKQLWNELKSNLAKLAIGMAFSFIPGIGPLSSFGGLLGGGKVPSAAGGWSVPKGWNGLAMIHEEEVVLDRQTKRALMNGGGGSVSVSISAVDAPSLVALMQNNPEAILGPIREARRDRRF